jgi:hypothetical protein
MRVGGAPIWIACLLVAQSVGAEETLLPPPPDGYVELAWSTQFATTLVSRCSDFTFNKWDPRLIAFLDGLVGDGVDLDNAETVYAPPPDFTGASAKSLFEKSNIADDILPPTAGACDLAELVFGSDMLTAAMIRRVETEPGS